MIILGSLSYSHGRELRNVMTGSLTSPLAAVNLTFTEETIAADEQEAS